MKKIIFTILMLGLVFGATACKSSTAGQPEASEEVEQAETSESLHAVETLEIEIDPDTEGVIGSD